MKANCQERSAEPSSSSGPDLREGYLFEWRAGLLEGGAFVPEVVLDIRGRDGLPPHFVHAGSDVVSVHVLRAPRKDCDVALTARALNRNALEDCPPVPDESGRLAGDLSKQTSSPRTDESRRRWRDVREQTPGRSTRARLQNAETFRMRGGADRTRVIRERAPAGWWLPRAGDRDGLTPAEACKSASGCGADVVAQLHRGPATMFPFLESIRAA